MKLILITDKTAQSDRDAHWNLQVDTVEELHAYFKSFESRISTWLWDFLGDRDLKDKGNNPIGQWIDHWLHTIPEGEKVNLGQICLQADQQRNRKMLNMFNMLNRHGSLRISAGGGYCPVSMFKVIDEIEIDTFIMGVYVHDRSDKFEKMISYLQKKTMVLRGEEIAVTDIKKIYYQDYILYFDCELSTDAYDLLYLLNLKLDHIRKTYFKIDTKMEIKKYHQPCIATT